MELFRMRFSVPLHAINGDDHQPQLKALEARFFFALSR